MSVEPKRTSLSWLLLVWDIGLIQVVLVQQGPLQANAVEFPEKQHFPTVDPQPIVKSCSEYAFHQSVWRNCLQPNLSSLIIQHWTLICVICSRKMRACMHQSTCAVHFSILQAGFGPGVVLNVKCKSCCMCVCVLVRVRACACLSLCVRECLPLHPISQIPALSDDNNKQRHGLIKRKCSCNRCRNCGPCEA